jgi:stress-induced morphogen
MGRVTRGKSDQVLQSILDALREYEATHLAADVEVYRQNSASVRVRIIDPDFAGLDRAERHKLVWRMLERLPEDVLSDVTILLLLTPDEVGDSFANFDFEHPIPSRL